MITPYFHAKDFPFRDDRSQDKFRFGRISPGDADKFNIRQLWIYETMTAPELEEGYIVGWDHRAKDKFGREPDDYIETYPEGGMTQQDFYATCKAVIMTTDTFENLPRVAFEAMASGSVLVVDDRGGWRSLVEDGATGWLCQDDREFVYLASRCAFETEERERMRYAARDRLEALSEFPVASKSWGEVFKRWEILREPLHKSDFGRLGACKPLIF